MFNRNPNVSKRQFAMVDDLDAPDLGAPSGPTHAKGERIPFAGGTFNVAETIETDPQWGPAAAHKREQGRARERQEQHELNMMRTRHQALNVRQFPTGEDLAARAAAIKAKAMVSATPTKDATGQQILDFPEGGQASKWAEPNAARRRAAEAAHNSGEQYSDAYDYDMDDDERR